MAGKQSSWGFRVGERPGDSPRSVQGYVVVSGGDEFLSRRLKWIRHPATVSLVPLQQGFVHQATVILEGGPWASEASQVYAATYNAGFSCTEVKSPAIPFSDFLLRERAKKSA
ncbi:MAG: hypothetical protein AAB903_00770 [Patescibacteria group bacterium]